MIKQGQIFPYALKECTKRFILEVTQMNGILPLWKPKGLTSHDCVMKIRRLFHTKKVGHTGTLDPQVEGVLPICIGQATKIVPYLMETKKTYIAEVMLGTSTETEDREGRVIEQKEITSPPSNQSIENTLQSFVGDIIQIPPMYSAVKVKGKRLYEYARANETVERPSRQITIHEIKRIPSSKETNHSFRIQVICSKGTYIRTLCVDIGKHLGYPAHMSDLVRIQTGSFTKDEAVTFKTIERASLMDKQNQLLLPIVKGLLHLNCLNVDETMKKAIQFGQKLPRPEQIVDTDPFIVLFHNQLLAIYQVHPEKPNLIKPVRVFNG